MSFNQGPQPAVINNENGIRYIDPNPTNQIVNHEDLVVYVKLVARSKGRSILTNDGDTTVIENELRNVKSKTNFTYTTGKNYIDTDWTNIGGGPQTLGTDLGGFGITNINIEFKSSFMPQITIDFVDVRGASLFEQGPCSPYSVFFHLPYPVFELTVKGYYGRPVTYTLALVKFTTKFNSETGNFESKGEFVGYTYAFLADIPMGYVMASTFMRGDYNGQKTLAEKWELTVNKPEFADSFYGLNKDEPLTIFDLIVKSKQLETKLPQLKNTTEVLEVTQLARIRNELNEFKSEIEEYARELLNVITISSTSGVRAGSNPDRKTLYYFRLPKGTTTSKRIRDVNILNKKYLATDGPPGTAEGYPSSRIGIKQSTVSGIYAVNKLTDPPVIEFANIQNGCSGFLGSELKQNTDFPDFDEYSIDIWDSLLKPIEEKLKSIDEKYQAKREEVQTQLNNAVREILGFWPSIRNVFAVITTNTEVFLELLAQASDQAETYHDNNDITQQLGGDQNRKILDLKNYGGAQSSTDKQPKVYAWPTYYEKIPKPDGIGDAGEKETFPGDNAEFSAWPEVRFVEEFIVALTELREQNEDFNVEETAGEPGFDNYAPITAFETHAFGETKAPNRWLSIQNGVPGVDELIDSVYCVAGENAFLLGDYSMINALTLWKSQLGFDNGWGFNFETNGFSKDLVTGESVPSRLNYVTNSEAAAAGINNLEIGPARIAENPNVFNDSFFLNLFGDFKRTRRYKGAGFLPESKGDAPLAASFGVSTQAEVDSVFASQQGTAFPESDQSNWIIDTPKDGVGGADTERAMWPYKISPTTLKKMRVWGRVDALNMLQTLADDGQTDLLIEIQAALTTQDAAGLKDLIKKALTEKYSSNFKSEKFNDWKKTATAEINNGTPLTDLIDKQGEIWNSYYQYQKNNDVLTLKGPIPLNYSELVGTTEISANPYNNPNGGVILLTKSEKENRTIKLSTEEGNLVGGDTGFLKQGYVNNYGDTKKGDDAAGSSGIEENVDGKATAISENNEVRTGLNFGGLNRKPRFNQKPKDSENYNASPYYKKDSNASFNAFEGLAKVGGDRAANSFQLDPNLNMLMYDIKSFRQNFYLDYTSLNKDYQKNGKGDDTQIDVDLGSSRQIYSYNFTPGFDTKQFSDFVGTNRWHKNNGTADAFVQTPLWTLNYPAWKNPLMASRTFISAFEAVNRDLTETNPRRKALQFPQGLSTEYIGNSNINLTRNYSTWWGINSYYDAGGETGIDDNKYVLPSAYLAVMSFGWDPIGASLSSEGAAFLSGNRQKTGHMIPFDGNNFSQEGCFSNFGHQHVVAEPPKAWLLLMGAILWRASEGGVLNYEWGGQDGLTGQFGTESFGWNRLNDSKNIKVNDTNGNPLQTNDMNDPVWFFHNSISKPRRLNGTIPSIVTDYTTQAPASWGGNFYGPLGCGRNSDRHCGWPGANEYMNVAYRRRYLGYDRLTGIDRWTDSGGDIQFTFRQFRNAGLGDGNDGPKPNELTLVNPNNPSALTDIGGYPVLDHVLAGHVIGPWLPGAEPGTDKGDDDYNQPINGLPHPPLYQDGRPLDDYFYGYTKSHLPWHLPNGGPVIDILPQVTQSLRFGINKNNEIEWQSNNQSVETIKKPINQGLFDQCRQDQMPFLVPKTLQYNGISTLLDEDQLANNVVDIDIRTQAEQSDIIDFYADPRIMFPHTLVMLDTSVNRPSTGSTITVDGRTINTVNSPNLTKNGYLSMKERVKEVMFLPNQFKKQLIDYFVNWALREPYQDGTDSWLKRLDPLNYFEELNLGPNKDIKTTRKYTQWENFQKQAGYQGFQRTELYKQILDGTLYSFTIDGAKKAGANFEQTPGRFVDEFVQFNPWLLSYHFDGSFLRVLGSDPKLDAALASVGTSGTQSLSEVDPWFETSFVEGSKIMLSNKKIKNIEDIAKNDKILSYNIEKNIFEESTIRENQTRIANNLIVIELENGIKINCTEDHPIYVPNKGWATFVKPPTNKLKHLGQLKDLVIGDNIFYYKNNGFKEIKIKNIFKSRKQKRVFSIKGVTGNENYVVNNILVST